VSVALDVDGLAHALRSVRTAGGALTWANLERDSLPASAAIAGAAAIGSNVDGLALRSRAFASERQLAQLVAHRTSILALTGGHDLAQLAKQAIDDVRAAVCGHSIVFALERLPRLGLDVGYSCNRHALQLVINLAEANDRAYLLDHLVIEPCASAGAAHARNWLRDFATPQMLNDLSELARVDGLVRQLITYQHQQSDCAQRNEAFYG
jgi:hypothetical protein